MWTKRPAEVREFISIDHACLWAVCTDSSLRLYSSSKWIDILSITATTCICLTLLDELSALLTAHCHPPHHPVLPPSHLSKSPVLRNLHLIVNVSPDDPNHHVSHVSTTNYLTAIQFHSQFSRYIYVVKFWRKLAARSKCTLEILLILHPPSKRNEAMQHKAKLNKKIWDEMIQNEGKLHNIIHFTPVLHSLWTPDISCPCFQRHMDHINSTMVAMTHEPYQQYHGCHGDKCHRNRKLNYSVEK